ncbi:hypothetical protein FB446DRAFT_436938 [Lentinula raphanica]|nr:hypothetical protein FB446DRAFT_436938 [Lentinula raphanica]
MLQILTKVAHGCAMRLSSLDVSSMLVVKVQSGAYAAVGWTIRAGRCTHMTVLLVSIWIQLSSTTTIMQTTLLNYTVLLSFFFLVVTAAPDKRDTPERRALIARACPAACAINCPDCCVNINCPDLCC